jgi:hypothetical protein
VLLGLRVVAGSTVKLAEAEVAVSGAGAHAQLDRKRQPLLVKRRRGSRIRRASGRRNGPQNAQRLGLGSPFTHGPGQAQGRVGGALRVRQLARQEQGIRPLPVAPGEVESIPDPLLTSHATSKKRQPLPCPTRPREGRAQDRGHCGDHVGQPVDLGLTQGPLEPGNGLVEPSLIGIDVGAHVPDENLRRGVRELLRRLDAAVPVSPGLLEPPEGRVTPPQPPAHRCVGLSAPAQ